MGRVVRGKKGDSSERQPGRGEVKGGEGKQGRERGVN